MVVRSERVDADVGDAVRDGDAREDIISSVKRIAADGRDREPVRRGGNDDVAAGTAGNCNRSVVGDELESGRRLSLCQDKDHPTKKRHQKARF